MRSSRGEHSTGRIRGLNAAGRYWPFWYVAQAREQHSLASGGGLVMFAPHAHLPAFFLR